MSNIIWAGSSLETSRAAISEADFGSPGESRAFEQLYAQCARYSEQTNNPYPEIVTAAIERELPRLREAVAHYREAVIQAAQERDRTSISPTE